MATEQFATAQTMRTPIFRAIAATAAAVCLGSPVAAVDSVLTLSRGPGDFETLTFTLEELGDFQQVTIETENEFVDGKVAFRGPLVRDIIQHLALDNAEVLRFTAANDYSVEIPTRDFLDYDVILAMAADGKPLSRRDKGPLWLMYPISDNAELENAIYVTRLIWQVVRIESL